MGKLQNDKRAKAKKKEKMRMEKEEVLQPARTLYSKKHTKRKCMT